MLEQKAAKTGTVVVKVGRFYPSSKTCSCCGHVKSDLALSDRIYVCEACGMEIDRDYNASLNILNEGLRLINTV
jgi:putative transposase